MNMTITSDGAMKRLGARIGALLGGGEVIELIGDVGAGKTTLTKGIAAGMGIDEDVQSPSFTISRTYDTPGGLHLAHYDFYRLHDAGIMADELRETAADDKTVTIIEWAEIVANVLPRDRLTLTIVAASDTDRTVTLSAAGGVSRRLLKDIHDSTI